MNLSEGGFYYNVTDRDIHEVLDGFGLDLGVEIATWPHHPHILVSGLGSHERLERYLLENVPGIKMTGIDASLGLDDGYIVVQDEDGVYHLNPLPPLRKLPNSRVITYKEYKEERLRGVPDIDLITERVPPIDIPDSSIDVVIDINGPAAYSYQEPSAVILELLGEYERISREGIVYVATSQLLYPEVFYKGVMGTHRSVSYTSGSQGDIAKIVTG